MRTPNAIAPRQRQRHSRPLALGLATALGWGFPALSAGAETAAAGAEAFEPAILEEVTVTARKVAERLADVPMSIQVLGGELLEELDRSSLFDLQFEVPGLVVNAQGIFGAGFSLRGVGSQGGGPTTVARHWNGVYLASSHLALARLFDMERIEVLKGPQGTLYGRNSTAGSINFITRAPEPQFAAALEGAWGSFSTGRAEGHVNLPFDGGAARLAFVASEGDGFLRNTEDARRFGESDYRGIRLSARLNPAERWQVDFALQRVVDDGGAAELWSPQLPHLPDPDDIHLIRVTLANPFVDAEADTAALTLSHNFGFAELRSITGYARNDVRDREDCAAEPRLEGCVREVDPVWDEQWSQELQLVSAAGAGIDWLAGLQWFTADSFTHFFNVAPALNPRPRNDADWTSDETAYAAFGQVSVPIGERWRITGGLRYGHERRAVSSVGTGVQDPPQLLSDRDGWDGLSWRADLQFTPKPGAMLYANVATGLNSGGITNQRLPIGELDRYDEETLTAYELGGKFRWRDGRLALDAAAFRYDFDDLQISTVRIVGLQILSETDNAARAEIYGLDASFAARPTQRATLSAAAVWLPKREFTDYRNELTGDTLSGNVLARAPEWSALAALDYGIVLNGRGRLSARLEYAWRGGVFYTEDNTPEFSQDGFGLLNLLLRFEAATGGWYVFASGRNLTDEDYFNQVFLQASPGYPDTYEIGLGVRF